MMIWSGCGIWRRGVPDRRPRVSLAPSSGQPCPRAHRCRGGRDTHDGHENSPILVFFSNLLGPPGGNSNSSGFRRALMWRSMSSIPGATPLRRAG